MSTKKNKVSLQNKESFSRMNYLYQASMLMAGKNNTLSAYYGGLCRNISKKAVLKIHPDVKRNFCKRCSLAQKPGITADLNIVDSQHGKSTRRKRRKTKSKQLNIDDNADVQITCQQCGYKRSFKVNTEYNFWLENKESIAEKTQLNSYGNKTHTKLEGMDANSDTKDQHKYIEI